MSYSVQAIEEKANEMKKDMNKAKINGDMEEYKRLKRRLLDWLGEQDRECMEDERKAMSKRMFAHAYIAVECRINIHHRLDSF